MHSRYIVEMKEDSISGRGIHIGKGSEGENHGRVEEVKAFNMVGTLIHGNTELDSYRSTYVFGESCSLI